jgi:hypothetical protein
MTTADRPFISDPIRFHGSDDPRFYLRKGCTEVCQMVINEIPFETDEAICLEAANAIKYFEAAHKLEPESDAPLLNLALLHLYGGYTAAAMHYTSEASTDSETSIRLEVLNTFISKTFIEDTEINGFCEKLPQFETEIREVYAFLKKADGLSEKEAIEAQRYMWREIIPPRITKEKGTSLWAMA